MNKWKSQFATRSNWTLFIVTTETTTTKKYIQNIQERAFILCICCLLERENTIDTQFAVVIPILNSAQGFVFFFFFTTIAPFLPLLSRTCFIRRIVCMCNHTYEHFYDQVRVQTLSIISYRMLNPIITMDNFDHTVAKSSWSMSPDTQTRTYGKRRNPISSTKSNT